MHKRLPSKETGKIFIEAEVDVVAISNSGKLYRRMPEVLSQVFERAFEMSGIRLNKYIASSGLCSRRKADELIESGVVSVNGKKSYRAGFSCTG